MRKILISTFIITLIISSCSKEKPIDILNKVDVKEFTQLANKENPSDFEIELLDYNFRLLSNEEFIEFSLLSIDYLIEGLTEKEVIEFNNSKDSHLERLTSYTKKAGILFDKPITQLTNDELRKVLNETKTNVAKASCINATFNNYVCRSNSYDTNPSGWQRMATPNDPTDCDYEYYFNGYKSTTYGKTWSARFVLDWWGSCGIATRYSQWNFFYSTGILIGDDAINFLFWGSGNFFKKKIGMR